jgi:hypothetical protein
VPGFDGQVIAFSPDSTTLATLHDRRAGALLTLWDVASLLDGDE